MVTEQKLQEFGAYAVELTRIGLGALKEYRYKELSLYAIESATETTYCFKKGEEVKEYSDHWLAVSAFCQAVWEDMQ